VNNPYFSKGQSSLKIDLLGTIYGATENSLNINVYFEKKTGPKSSFQIGLSAGRFIKEETFRDERFGIGLDYNRALVGLGIVPEFRYFLKAGEDSTLPKGLFISPYGKFYLSKVNHNDLRHEIKKSERGYVIGLGLGLGYKIQINKCSITPFLGLGKGISSHEDIFKPGGFALDFVSPDLLIHRAEVLVGYNLN